MPVLTGGARPQVTDLAARLVADLSGGGAARQTFGTRDAAFSWTTGMPSVIATAVTPALVEGLTFGSVLIAPSVTPVAKIGARAAKPVAVTLTSQTHTLNKYAGICVLTYEQTISTEQIIAAVNATLVGQSLMAFDADSWAALDAADATAATGATWSAAILAGIAEVAARGGNPDVLVLAAADYAAAVEGAAAGYTLSPVDAVPVLFGLRVVVSAAGTAGKGFVLDSSAVTAAENVSTPTVLVDPYSMSDTNEVRVVSDYFALLVVTSPGGIAEISKTP